MSAVLEGWLQSEWRCWWQQGGKGLLCKAGLRGLSQQAVKLQAAQASRPARLPLVTLQ